MLNEIPSPCLIPAPHRLGFVQVVFPPGTTFQPWLVSSDCAVEGENEHGPSPIADVLTSGLGGDSGIGPQVGSAVSYRKAWIQPCWSIRCWNAFRKYGCRKMYRTGSPPGDVVAFEFRFNGK